MTGICIPFCVAVADVLRVPVVSQALEGSSFLSAVCTHATAPASTSGRQQKSPTSYECQNVTE